MIVDDEEIVTQSLGSFLEFETDYAVQAFQSPHEALTSLKKRPVDVVISDFLMPQMSGLEFLGEVRKLYPDVPRIILTGYADKENAIKAINEVGLYQYLEKPWDNDHLRLIVRNAIGTKSLSERLQDKIHELDQALRQRDELSRRDDFIRRELEMARCVQKQLLPEELPAVDGFSLDAVYRPSMEVGGDFYDAVRLADGRWALLVADITGHGIQAALCMTLLKFAFASYCDTDADLSDMTSGMNTVLHRGLPVAMFVAALIIQIDPAQRRCVVANAGLPYPLLLRKTSGEVEQVCNAGLLLGVTDEQQYRPSEGTVAELEPGDRLIVFTDGVTEARNDRGELTGSDGASRQLKACSDLSLPDTLKHLADRATAAAGDRDDVTLLGIEAM